MDIFFVLQLVSCKASSHYKQHYLSVVGHSKSHTKCMRFMHMAGVLLPITSHSEEAGWTGRDISPSLRVNPQLSRHPSIIKYSQVEYEINAQLFFLALGNIYSMINLKVVISPFLAAVCYSALPI